MKRLLTALLLVWAAGCHSRSTDKFVTVEGQVKVAGNPLTTGQIGFIPDESEGTTHPEYSIGDIGPDGHYRLVTNSTSGVRPGKYKVVVWSSVEPMSPTPSYGPDGKLAPIAWRTATRYTTKETTDLRVEVVESPSPGAYDFNLDPPQ